MGTLSRKKYVLKGRVGLPAINQSRLSGTDEQWEVMASAMTERSELSRLKAGRSGKSDSSPRRGRLILETRGQNVREERCPLVSTRSAHRSPLPACPPAQVESRVSGRRRSLWWSYARTQLGAQTPGRSQYVPGCQEVLQYRGIDIEPECRSPPVGRSGMRVGRSATFRDTAHRHAPALARLVRVNSCHRTLDIALPPTRSCAAHWQQTWRTGAHDWQTSIRPEDLTATTGTLANPSLEKRYRSSTTTAPLRFGPFAREASTSNQGSSTQEIEQKEPERPACRLYRARLQPRREP